MRASGIAKRTMRKKLAILVLSEQGGPDIQTIQGLCQAAPEMGAEVEVFLMGDAVNHLLNRELDALATKGSKVSFCSLNTMERDIELSDPALNLFGEGSQFTLACIVHDTDRFLAFT